MAAISARQQILDSALYLFTEQGINSTTVNAIRQRAGVSNGSFFHAFASKEALAGELYLQCLTHYHEHLGHVLEDTRNTEATIAALLTAHVDWVVKQRNQAMFLFDQANAACLQHIRDAQAHINKRLQDRIKTWRDPLIANGTLEPMPLGVFTAQLIGPAQLLCRAWLAGRSEEAPHQHLEQLAANAQRALLAR